MMGEKKKRVGGLFFFSSATLQSTHEEQLGVTRIDGSGYP
jgi:hypothetical protein